MKSILIIDDEIEICESIKMILEYEDYHVEFATNPSEGLDKIRSSKYEVILLDINMPELNGFEVLQKVTNDDIEINVIMISAHSSVENAVKATKLGAFDFIEKPIDRDKLLITVRNAVNQNELKKENKELKNSIEDENIIIGESESLKRVLETAKRVAVTESRILITGENGTGKELIAKEIHKFSKRKDKPFIEVNCAAIPNELIESELFGHEKGAFTGAANKRIGKFELAHGGTLFLDEIGDMSLNAQAKVLKAIEEGKIERVGGTETIDVDVRLISATNKDLQKEISERNFREDLFHRLNVIPLNIPPLRERKNDIELLINHFNKRISRKYNFTEKKFSKEAVELLKDQKWSGNVRELKNIIERILIMLPDEQIDKSDIVKLIPTSNGNDSEIFDISNSFQEFKEKAEKMFIQKQLELNEWNISKTAEVLGIQRSHLYGKMKKYNIEKG
ncbi:MAG: sigma-54 dependent transcriptional regulator [Melioribacteraceae bacterium]|nr:sigma-54 dependent transcriptional regulator [Melioribacteraceae bacterium]